MGWRDRVDKSFANFGDIANRDQKLKKTEKERKEGSKVFSSYPSHNSQYSQKPKDKTGVDRKPGSAIPAPSPPGMGPEYDDLWNRAWGLAEWIDNPDGAPIEERRAKLPELDRLRAEMDAIVQAEKVSNETNGEATTATSDSKEIKQIKPPGTWHTWESSSTTTRDRSAETCPAQCRKTGKCYARAYFEGKLGRAAECDVGQCSRAKDYKS
jgi:hypothetical protein